MSQPHQRLSDAEWRQLSAAVKRLESALWDGDDTAIEDFLPTVASELLRQRTLIELIKVDQELRLARGERRIVEDYLAKWPEIASDDTAVVELIQAECVTRSETGSPVSRGGLASRFSQYLDELDRLFPVGDDAWLVASTPDSGNDEETPTPRDVHAVTEVGNRRRIGASELLPGESLEGRTLGRYLIGEEIGRGGMGCVYVARDPTLNRDVALKIPRPELIGDPEARQRFLSEATTAAAIRHPGVCRVYDFGETDGICWIAMELIDDESLLEWSHSDQCSPVAAARVILKSAQALAAVHEAGIVHRDIKTSNIVINSKGQPILMDFGLARDEADEARVTGSAIQGTLAYMPPERLEKEPLEFDAQGDLYSLGVVFYELLTGRLPFEGRVDEVLHAIGQKKPTHPSQIHPDIPDALADVCLRAMARSRSERFQSVAEFAQAMKETLRATSGTQPSTSERGKAIEGVAIKSRRGLIATSFITLRGWLVRMTACGWIAACLLLSVHLLAIFDGLGVLRGAIAEALGLLSFLVAIGFLCVWGCVAIFVRHFRRASRTVAGRFSARSLTTLFVTVTAITGVQVQYWTSFDFDRLWTYGYRRHSERQRAAERQRTLPQSVTVAEHGDPDALAVRFGEERDDVAEAVAVDRQGNVYAVGGIGVAHVGFSTSGNSDIVVAKWSREGKPLWHHRLGGHGADGAMALALDSRGDLLIAGVFQETVDFDPRKRFPDRQSSRLSAGSSGTPFGLFVMKLTADGRFVWVREIASESGVWKQVYDLAVDSGDSILLCGHFMGSVDFDPGNPGGELTPAGNQDSFLVKLDTDGKYQWARAYGGPRDDGFNEYAGAVAVDSDCNVYLGGRFYDTTDFDVTGDNGNTDTLTAVSDGDAFVLSADPDGRFRWVKRLGRNVTGVSNERGNEIIQDLTVTDRGTVVVAGEFKGADFDPGSGEPKYSSLSGADGFVSEFRTDTGDFVWSVRVGNTGDDRCRAVAAGADGTLYVAGFYNLELHVQEGAEIERFPQSQVPAIPNLGQLFVVGFDAERRISLVMPFGTRHGDDVTGLRVVNKSHLMVSGYFSGESELSLYGDGRKLRSAGRWDAFVVEIDRQQAAGTRRDRQP